MNSASDHLIEQYRRVKSSRISGGSEVFDPTATYNKDIEAKASSEQLRACLIDGTVLLHILTRLRPGFSYKEGGSRSENVKKFLECMDELGILKFELSDLETGSMKNVMDCLSTLRAQFVYLGGNLSPTSGITRMGSPRGDASNLSPTSGITRFGSPRGDASSSGHFSPTFGEEKRRFSPESKSQQALEPSVASMYHVGHKFHEVFQLKQGRFSDLSAAKISEMMKSNSLDNAPTQSLLCVVNGILDESIERKSYEMPHRVACLLRKVVQEIERRISTQAEHLRTQNNLFKAREEKYQSRIRVLEALASGTGEERGAVMDQLQHLKIEKSKIEEERKLEEERVAKLIIEREQKDLHLSTLKQELELEKETHELRHLQRETEAKDAQAGLEERLKELELHLEDSKNQVKVLQAHSQSKSKTIDKKEDTFKGFVEFQLGALQGMRISSKSIKQEILQVQKSYTEEFNGLEVKLKALIDATGDYHLVVAENRRMFNELQELKGHFFPGQVAKQTAVEYIGENGELAVVNPSKQVKDRRRNFKFNKVFGPDSTQEEVYSDTQPLIRSVLDGYSVCIFAYGQTGSGKTYTMTGPNGASEEDWGVNYRALNDLFQLSQSRRGSFNYEIQSTVQTNGLAVPDASMHPVTSTSDVVELMDIGLKNRAVGATSMNERSSRSHSVVSIHVRGKDLPSGAALHGNLHLVDLAGSERVDRSEATGDRLREAQHINKSLSALGRCYIRSRTEEFSRGQAKTLMFVQLNPDATSYSETTSTLKFAERVSGVELGAARSSKDGRDVRELMNQMASLKDTIAKKDDEIERLEVLKDVKTEYPGWIRKSMGNETVSYQESNSEYSDRHSETGSQQSKLSEGDTVGEEPDGETDQGTKLSNKLRKSSMASNVRLLQNQAQATSKTATVSRDNPKGSTSIKKTGNSNLIKSSKRWQ
ncbi:KINESIN-4-LIKE ISOFORM X1 [Salix viminalis]|uniref:KINESIN-4-LIKE ISOFORM X1 n=1 Tax=Salix viminalis TaxID=40686 RepID=A0A9Q0NML4_SALVM|nr:KINESIN-4-LIKE ISOFORM X1 [Salix viminalis]